MEWLITAVVLVLMALCWFHGFMLGFKRGKVFAETAAELTSDTPASQNEVK